MDSLHLKKYLGYECYRVVLVTLFGVCAVMMVEWSHIVKVSLVHLPDHHEPILFRSSQVYIKLACKNMCWGWVHIPVQTTKKLYKIEIIFQVKVYY